MIFFFLFFDPNIEIDSCRLLYSHLCCVIIGVSDCQQSYPIHIFALNNKKKLNLYCRRKKYKNKENMMSIS